MLASLPMYDLPEARDATDAFWAAIAKAYGVEGRLTRNAEWSSTWRDANLLFSQTCGYPFTHEFAGVLKYVATPQYNAEGCEGPNYCSIVFAREKASLESFRGKIAAINSSDSMSGMLALKLVFAEFARAQRFFSVTKETGGHVASLATVQSGEADVCAIDCVTVALLRKYRPSALQGLVEIARSPLIPGLPYVTRSGDIPRLCAAIDQVMRDDALAPVRAALLIKGVSVLRPEDYDVILTKENSVQHRIALG